MKIQNKLLLCRLTSGENPLYCLTSYRFYKGKRYYIQVKIGRHPQVEAKLAYFKAVTLPKRTPNLARWQHHQKLSLLLEYKRIKQLVKTIEEASK